MGKIEEMFHVGGVCGGEYSGGGGGGGGGVGEEEVNVKIFGGEDDVATVVLGGGGGEEDKGKSDGGEEEEEEGESEDGDGEVYEVECILKERSRKGCKEYLVHWKGYGEEFDSWEPSDNLNCEDAMEQFRKQREEEKGQGKGKGRGGGGRNKKGRSKGSTPMASAAPGGSRAKKRKSQRESSGGEDDDEEAPLVIRCKTIFKKHLIENAIKFENRRTSDDDNNPDPKVRYYMRYDIETGEVFVGDVKIDVDEVKKELVCTSCSKVYSEERRLEDKLENPNKKPLALWHIMREMKLHVIGFHLGGFTCPHCDEEEAFHTRGSTHFYRHMSTKHKDILDAQRANLDID